MMLSIGTGLTFVKNYVAAVFGGNTSYNPVHVFGSDLVTWYGDNVEELWAEHRKCWEDSPELVVNGGFDSADGWTLDAGVTVTDGVLSFNTSTTQSATRASALPLVSGRSYRVEVTVTKVSGSIEVFVGNTVSGAANSTGKHSFVIVSSAANQNIQIRSLGAGVFTVDNISVRELDFSNSRLFSDNLGTTPVTGLEQTAGLILDKSKGLELGPELIGSGGTWNLTSGVTQVGETSFSFSAVTSGSAAFTAFALPTTPGPFFKIEFQISAVSGGAAGVRLASNSAVTTVRYNAVGLYSVLIPVGTAAPTNRNIVFDVSGFTGTASLVSVRELPGHHLYQPTATARGRLSARYNTVNQTENLAHADWFREGDIDVVGQTITVLPGSTLARVVRQQGRLGTALGLHTATIEFSVVGHCRVVVGLTSQFVNAYVSTAIDSVSGEVVNTVNPNCTHINTSVENLGGGRFRVAVTGIRVDGSAQAWGAGLWIVGPTQNATYPQQVWDSAGGVTVTVHGIDCRRSAYPASWPQYQRVTTASDYDTVGFPARLVMDGVDDRWVTGNIDLTGVSGFSVWSSALRAGSTDRRVLAAFGEAISTLQGFNLESADTDQTPPGFGLRVRTGGSGQLSVQPSVLGQPYAVYAEWDAGTQIGASRLNGVPAVPTPTSSGATGLGSQQLNVGGRLAGTNPWHGDIFSLPMIVRRLATPEEITAAEKAFGKAIGVLQ
jgi:hypothetical protein